MPYKKKRTSYYSGAFQYIKIKKRALVSLHKAYQWSKETRSERLTG